MLHVYGVSCHKTLEMSLLFSNIVLSVHARREDGNLILSIGISCVPCIFVHCHCVRCGQFTESVPINLKKKHHSTYDTPLSLLPVTYSKCIVSLTKKSLLNFYNTYTSHQIKHSIMKSYSNSMRISPIARKICQHLFLKIV